MRRKGQDKLQEVKGAAGAEGGKTRNKQSQMKKPSGAIGPGEKN